MGNTLLIDGSNLFIIHLTANPSTSQDGIPTGGVKGFLNSLIWFNRVLKPERIIIFFDGKGGSSERREIFSEYKEGRKPKQIVGRYYKFSDSDKAEKNVEYQQTLLKSILENLPVNVITSKGFETDDGIAYCVKHKNYFKMDKIYIVSCDKDFYQLISDDVSIYNPMSKKIIDAKYVLEDFGIHPKNWLFYRSVAGDKSDNVDGIKGIGPKNLLKLFALEDPELIHTPEDIDEFYAVKDELKDKSKQNKIVQLYENKSKIERNWKLMNLSEPLISTTGCEKLTAHIDTFVSSYKKIDAYSQVAKLGLNPSSFDELRFLK